MSQLITPADPDDTNLYQDEHVLLPGSSASSVSLDEIQALAAQEDQATRALAAAEAIAAPLWFRHGGQTYQTTSC